MSKKEVVKAGNTEIAVFDASMMEADAGSGMENMGMEDLALPFLKVLSGNDPVLDDDTVDARKGDIYNTVTGVAYRGKDGVRVVPCSYQRRFIQWAPRGSGSGAPMAIYDPGDVRPKTERSSEDNKDYVVDGNGRYIERTAQHYVLVLDKDGMTQQALISMKATQFKKSKQWNSALKSLKMKDSNGRLFTPARFSHIWLMKSQPEENKNGSWHGWEISKDSQIEDLSLYQEAKLFAESINAGQVKVQHTREEDATDSDDVPF